MKADDYNQAQTVAQELVDWLFTKTTNAQMQVLILGRAIALHAALARADDVTPAEMQRGLLKALKAEFKVAERYVQRERRKACATVSTKN